MSPWTKGKVIKVDPSYFCGGVYNDVQSSGWWFAQLRYSYNLMESGYKFVQHMKYCGIKGT